MRKKASVMLPVPSSVNRKLHASRIPPDQAETLRRVELLRAQGRAWRGYGQSRSADVAASASNILNAGAFTRRDCRVLLVDGSESGTLRASMGSGAGVAGQFPCAGPLPECTEGALTDTYGCNSCEDCVAAGGPCNGGYDIDVTITNAEVPAGLAFYRTSFAGERYVKPCSGPGCSSGFVQPSARVKVRVTNNSSYCVRGQFFFSVFGLSCGCTLAWKDIADVSYSTLGTSAYRQAWWFFCLQGGGSVFTGCIEHAVQGGTYCCGRSVVISDWLGSWRCSNGSPDGPCGSFVGCAACP